MTTFRFQLVVLIISMFLKGYSHLEYLKSINPKRYKKLNYFSLFLRGAHWECPELLFPYIKRYKNQESNGSSKYSIAVLFLVIELAIITSIIFS